MTIRDLFKEEYDLSKPEFDYRPNRPLQLCRLTGRNLLALAIIIIIWYAMAIWVMYSRGVEFPTPLDTFIRLWHLLRGENLYEYSIYKHLLNSLYRWGIGYLLAVIVGLALGILLGVSRLFNDVIMPTVLVIQLIPGLAWIPIALLLFGIGDTSTIFMIFITALAPIVINTSGGMRGVPKMYVKAAEMMGASKPRIFLQVMLPASTLSIINGLRIGLANGWRVLIAAEMIVGVGLGLGYSIIQARWSLDFEAAFVCIAIICIIGLLIEKVVFVVIERRITEKMGFADER